MGCMGFSYLATWESDSSCILYIDHCQLGGRGTTEVFNSDVLIDTNLESSNIFQIEITVLVYYAM